MRRLLLFALLLNGLAPSSGELVEVSVHRFVDGHPPRLTEAEAALGSHGHEPDHGATADLCECCSIEPVMPAELAVQAPALASFGRLHGAGDPYTEDRSRLLFRPPMAS